MCHFRQFEIANDGDILTDFCEQDGHRCRDSFDNPCPYYKEEELSPKQRLLNERYLKQEELYKAAEMLGRTHPNVLAISAELDQICLQLQMMGEVIDGSS